MIELHPSIPAIKGKTYQEALSLVSERFPEASKLKVHLTKKNLVEQSKAILSLFLQGKNVLFDLPNAPQNTIEDKLAYKQLKELKPYCEQGFENFLLSDEVPSEFKKKYFSQLSNEAQTALIERIYQKGKISKIEPIFPKLAWLAENKDLPNGLLWLLNQNNFLPPIEKNWNKQGTVRGNWFVFADKPGGVEEGFLAVPLDNAFLNYFVDYLESQKEINPQAYNAFYPIDSRKTLIQKLQKASKLGQHFLKNLSLEMWEQTKLSEIPLDVFMFKQDYQGKKRSVHQKAFGSEPSYVSPSINRLKKDPFIEETLPVLFHRIAAEIKKRSRALQLPIDQNTNAIIETFANDLLRNMGLETQDGKLIFSSYEDGSLKILSACLWQKGAKPGKMYLKENYSPNYEGCYVKNPEQVDAPFFESMPIKNSGCAFIAALAVADRDFIGWDGNNKMILPSDEENGFRLFSIDPGLALREESSILDHLGTDFSFRQPLLITYKYKNLTAITDNPISEKMMGMFILYHTMPLEWRQSCFTDESEIKAIEAAIQKYRDSYPEFAQQMDQIKAHSIEDTFKKYWEYLAIQLDDETRPIAWREQCAHALNQLDEAYGRLARNTSKLICTFKQRMTLLPQELTFLDQMEKKFSDVVSNYSPCGTIKLNHPRVVSGRAIFGMQKHQNKQEEVDSILLKVPLNKKQNFIKYLEKIIGKDRFWDRTTFWDAEGKIILSYEHFKLLLERVLTPEVNEWIDEAFTAFYQQYLLQKSPEEINLFINEIPDEIKRNKALQAIQHEDPKIRESLCCEILKDHLLTTRQEMALEGEFTQTLHFKLDEAIQRIKSQLTPDQYKQLQKQIREITDKMKEANQTLDSTTLLGRTFIKHLALKEMESLYQTFDAQYSKGICGFFGGQTTMRRDFFHTVLTAFEENDDFIKPVPSQIVKQRFREIGEELAQRCSFSVVKDNPNGKEFFIVI